MNWHTLIQNELDQLSEEHALRTLKPRQNGNSSIIQYNSKNYLQFCSNDYLGLAHHPEILSHAHECALKWGNGVAGSRHLGGDTELAHQVEVQIAQLKSMEAALLFNTGYQANVALGSVFKLDNACLFADELCHASLWDGIRMGGIRFQRYNHRNLEHLSTLLNKHQGPKIICTESVFSMDGDQSDLTNLLSLSRQHQAILIVDEAHGDGLLGPKGQGLCASLQLEKDDLVLCLSTFGKAYGVMGAAISGPEFLKTWMIQKARSLIYSTSLTPWNLGAISASLRIAHQESWRREQALNLAQQFRRFCTEYELWNYDSSSQIVPVHMGSNEKAMQFSKQLWETGIWVHPVRPPTVPKEQARLRINFCAFHTEENLTQLTDQLRNIL